MTRAALAGLLLVGCHGCASLGIPEAKVQRQLDVFECKVAALRPHVGAVYDAEDLVRDVLAGKADPLGAMLGLGASVDEAKAAVAAWRACDAPPAPSPKSLVNL